MLDSMLLNVKYCFEFWARANNGSAFPDHQVVAMPALSPTMTQGNIGTWQKNAGDSITAGDVLVEIETDKAQMDFECQDEGFLAKVLVDSGTKDVAVGNPIAVLVEEEGSVDAFKDFTIDDAGGAAKPPPPKKEESKKEQPKEEKKSDDDAEKKKSSKPKSDAAQKPSGPREIIFASPLARRLAVDAGIPLRQIKGSGPEGRITRKDVESYSGGAASTSTAGPLAGYTDTPLSGMRRTIASRLSESKNGAPHYYLTISVDMSKLMKLRKALNSDPAVKISVNDLIVKSCGLALHQYPAANVSYLADEGVLRQYANVDVAVAVATPAGLLTPIIKGVPTKGLRQISLETVDLGKRARDGKLKPEEYTGGTFTISNLGMMGIEQFTAIVCLSFQRFVINGFLDQSSSKLHSCSWHNDRHTRSRCGEREGVQCAASNEIDDEL